MMLLAWDVEWSDDRKPASSGGSSRDSRCVDISVLCLFEVLGAGCLGEMVIEVTWMRAGLSWAAVVGEPFPEMGIIDNSDKQ